MPIIRKCFKVNEIDLIKRVVRTPSPNTQPPSLLMLNTSSHQSHKLMGQTRAGPLDAHLLPAAKKIGKITLTNELKFISSLMQKNTLLKILTAAKQVRERLQPHLIKR